MIDGGAGFAREVYEREGRGAWAQAMPLVLEKLGYLGLETAPPGGARRPAYMGAPRGYPRAAPAGRGLDAARAGLAGSGEAQLLVE